MQLQSVGAAGNRKHGNLACDAPPRRVPEQPATSLCSPAAAAQPYPTAFSRTVPPLTSAPAGCGLNPRMAPPTAPPPTAPKLAGALAPAPPSWVPEPSIAPPPAAAGPHPKTF